MGPRVRDELCGRIEPTLRGRLHRLVRQGLLDEGSTKQFQEAQSIQMETQRWPNVPYVSRESRDAVLSRKPFRCFHEFHSFTIILTVLRPLIVCAELLKPLRT